MSRGALALLAVLALALALALAPPAAAEVVDLPRTRAKLVVPDGWTTVAARGVVAGYRAPDGSVLAVTRAAVPNPDAWRPKRRDAYLDEIERGVAASIRGYRKLARRFVQINGVPAFELEARRADGATLVVRILLFRTYALALVVEVPRGIAVTAARALAARFAPAVTHTSDTPDPAAP